MNTQQVIDLLKSNKNERGITHWNKLTNTTLLSFGIGLTVLRKIAKQIGRDAQLAKQLWESKYYDAKVISLLIDDPKTITIEQAQKQVEQLEAGYLAHVFSSCDATLAKSKIVQQLIALWTVSENNIRQRCGYGLLYELSKSKKKNTPNDEYFFSHIKTIEETYNNANKQLLLAMGSAIQGIGHRNINLHTPALALAKKIGPINFNEPGQTCEPYDVVKNLTSDYINKKFNL
ncbi:MAG: DNA alkylation repair protein [Saccharospirillaceae bacterium]|nr:DNA alkylation repair protein [Pseudomonadales bacterium]NRB79921.1 DNA alkylation repair protein [Saccharospirillaceae bacterium]